MEFLNGIEKFWNGYNSRKRRLLCVLFFRPWCTGWRQVTVQKRVRKMSGSIGSDCSYQKLRDVQPNPLLERATRGQGMTAVHPADEGLEPRSPMHLRTKTKNGSYIWPELAYHMHLNFEPAFSCSRTHWKVFERKILPSSNEKVRMYREKSALEELIVSGVCCWRLRLLRRSDQLLSIFVDSELQRTFSRATWLHLELNLSSHWNLDLDLHPCSNQNRYAFPQIARLEKLFLVDSSTLFCQHIIVSQKDNRDIFRGGTSKESSN